MFAKHSQSKDGKSVHAYTPQYNSGRWTCSKCPPAPVGDRKKGEPRFGRVSFNSKAVRDRHVETVHGG